MSLIDLDKISAPSFRNLSREFVYTGCFGSFNTFRYFKNFFFWRSFNVKQLRYSKIRIIKKYGSSLYLLVGSSSLAKKDSAKFEKKCLKTFIVFMSYVNDLLLSIALKFETTAFLGIPRDVRVFHDSFGLPALSESFSSKTLYRYQYSFSWMF